MLHEVARHSIHSSETLEVAVQTLSANCQQNRVPCKAVASSDTIQAVAFSKTLQALQFRLQVLQSLKARSQANEARLSNEITLVS